MARRSIGAPITVGSVLMVLLLALAAGWQVLVWTDLGSLADGTTPVSRLLLVLGTSFFIVVMAGLVWLCAGWMAELRFNQRQRAFLDAVTHEMKTPLASFRLGLDTLGRHELSSERRREFIGRMREDLDRLDRTVGQVLAAARAEEPGRAAQRRRERVDLAQVLEDCVAALRERFQLSEGAIRIEAGSTAEVRADPAELAIIFNNLLENAVKYSQAPVDVRVGIRTTSDGRVRVEIADQGIGIPSGELRKIFRRFYRVGRDVQRQAAGLGLGLFVVRAMVRRQGGRVAASSEGAGRGSRFIVTLRAAGRSARSNASALRVGPQPH
jgi:signal transduction histidine kinase